MIDLHCHILPAVDDGPESMEATLELARAQVAAGVERVAATPHVSWDMPTSSARMADGVAEVNAVLEREAIPLEIVHGGELAMTRVGDLTDDEVDGFRLGGGPWLLVESPLSTATMPFEDLLYNLQVRGHRILLAHPERCPSFQREPERLEALVSGGALTSVTAGAFAGRFGSTVERFTHHLAQAGLVHSVASDAHDTHRRPPGMRELLEDAGYGEQATWWCSQVPAAILAGDDIPPGPPPPEPKRRGGLARLLRRG